MITLLIGLPGSGKTWYAQNVLEYDYFVDDPKDVSVLPDITSTDHLVIADPLLCVSYPLAQEILSRRYPEHSIDLVFFENNPEKCRKNIEYRDKTGDNRYVDVTLNHLVPEYTIPNDVKIITIWSPENVDSN